VVSDKEASPVPPIANLGPNPRHEIDMAKINEAVQAALSAMPEENAVKGQTNGAPRMGRVMSAREARRARKDYTNADGHGGPGPVQLAWPINWANGLVTTELLPSTRAPRRLTAGRTR
jgi:hypothetical protein